MFPIKLKDETEIGAGFFGEGEGIPGHCILILKVEGSGIVASSRSASNG